MVSPSLKAVCQKYLEDNELVTAWEALLDVLKPYDELLWETNCLADQIGVHWNNRGGLGILLSKAFTNAEGHCGTGWSFSKGSEHAFALTATASNYSRGLEFNKNNADAQMDEVPPLSSPTAWSIGAGHVNVWVRCVKAGSKCSNKRLAPSGNLDKQELCRKHPGLAKAVSKGLRWTFIHGDVGDRFPLIPVIGQKFLNYRGQSATSEIEGLMTIAESAARLSSGSAVCDDVWKTAAREASSAKPFWTPWVLDMAAFAQGVGVDQIQEAAQIIEVCAKYPPEAAVTYGHFGSQFYSAAAKLKWNTLTIQHTRVMMSSVIANGLCPFSEMEDGRACLVRTQDFPKLLRRDNKARVAYAEDMMDQARILAAALPDVARLHAIGWNDARLFCHLTGRGRALEGKAFTTLRDAGQVPQLKCFGNVSSAIPL